MEKPSPILPHMPRHVKQLIVDSTDTSSRSSLRYCSKEFNNLAEKSGNFYSSLKLRFEINEMCVMISFSPDGGRRTRLEYRPHRNGYSLREQRNYQRELVRSGDFVEAAVSQFSKIFRNPRNRLEIFGLSFLAFGVVSTPEQRNHYEHLKSSFLDRFQTFLTSLSHQIAVKEFRFTFNGTQDDVLKILPYLKPGTLEKICLECSHPISGYEYWDVDSNKVSETEQWKQAEECKVLRFCTRIPFEKWTQFTKAVFKVDEFTVDAVRVLLERLGKSTPWKRTKVAFRNSDHQQLIEYLSQLGIVTTTTTEHIFELSPPKSNFPLTVYLTRNMITLIRNGA